MRLSENSCSTKDPHVLGVCLGLAPSTKTRTWHQLPGHILEPLPPWQPDKCDAPRVRHVIRRCPAATSQLPRTCPAPAPTRLPWVPVSGIVQQCERVYVEYVLRKSKLHLVTPTDLTSQASDGS